MNNLLSLLKIEFSKALLSSAFGFNKKKSISFISIALIITLIGVAFSALYTYIYAMAYVEAGASLTPILALFASVTSFVAFISGITQTQGIYISKDYDLLTSLPIKRKTIVASKIINLYLVELFYSAIIMIPSGVVLTILSNQFILLLFSVIITLFISAVPLVVSLFVSFLTSFIASKFKYANFISFALYVALFIGIMSISFFSSSGSSSDPTQVVNTFNGVAKTVVWINPSLLLVEKAVDGSYIFLLYFVLVNIILLALITLFLSFSYNKMHELVSSFVTKNKYVRKELKTKGEFKNLLAFEYKRFFNSKILLLNYGLSVLVPILLVVFSYITYASSLKGQVPNIEEYINEYIIYGSILICFASVMATTTSSTISIEGKNFWLIKTLPINKKTLLKAKIFIGLSLPFIGSIIASTLIVILFKPDIFAILMLYLLPLAYATAIVLFDLIINLAFYNLKWDNEQQIVKQSKAAFICTMSPMIIDVILAALLIGLGILVNKYFSNLLALGLLTALAILFYLYIMKKGPNKINNIEDL